MHLILTGATGLVGSGILHQMLIHPSVTKISILSRNPVPLAETHANSKKATVILHSDFNNYPETVLEQLKGAEGCVWALGTSSAGMEKEKYTEITKTYTLHAARALPSVASPKPFKFLYISGEGANLAPGVLTPMFGVVKGETEAELLALPAEKGYENLKVYNVRPAAVDPIQHEEIKEFIPQKKGIMKLLDIGLSPVIRAVGKNLNTPTREMGKVITELMLGNGEKLEGSGVIDGRTLSNIGLRRMGGW
ncbi:nucleoside-diphosphate-sugar epimerase [Botrytis cinerea]